MNEEMLLRRLAEYSFAVMIITICLSVAVMHKEQYDVLGQERDATRQEESLYVEATPTLIPQITRYPVEDMVQNRRAIEEEVWEVWRMISQDSMSILQEKVGSRCILIKKPDGEEIKWKVTESPAQYKITFQLSGATQNLYAASVLRPGPRDRDGG